MTYSLRLVSTLAGTCFVFSLKGNPLISYVTAQGTISGFGKRNGIQRRNSSRPVRQIALYACINTPGKRAQLRSIWRPLLIPAIGAQYAPSHGLHQANCLRRPVLTRLLAYGKVRMALLDQSLRNGNVVVQSKATRTSVNASRTLQQERCWQLVDAIRASGYGKVRSKPNINPWKKKLNSHFSSTR